MILGRTSACLCESANMPCVKDAFAMDVMIGARTSHSFLTCHVGIGSKCTLLVRRFLQDLRYLLYGHIIEASEWRNLAVLNRLHWSDCRRSTNGVNLTREKCDKVVLCVGDGCCSAATSSQDTCRWLTTSRRRIQPEILI